MGQRDGRARRKFSDESTRDAVELVRSTGRPIARVAEELGIYDSTLENWVRKADEQDAEHDELSADERARLDEVKAENAELRMERDLLKRNGFLDIDTTPRDGYHEGTQWVYTVPRQPAGVGPVLDDVRGMHEATGNPVSKMFVELNFTAFGGGT